MTNSWGSVVVGDEGSQDGLVGGVVVPDGGGKCEDALKYSCGDSVAGPAAVALEVELAFEGVVDRLDDLAERFEEAGAGSGSFVSEGGAQQSGAVAGEEALELGGGVALVGDEGLAGA